MSESGTNVVHEALLQAWDCAFADMPVTYLSGPITSGLRHVERLRSGLVSAEAKDAATQSNSSDLKNVALRLRHERGNIIVEPASLNIPNWSQREYISLWQKFIERHVGTIIFVPGWEFSLGSSLEFYSALKCGIRTEAISGSQITVDDAIELLKSSIKDISTGGGLETKELQALSDELKIVVEKIEQLRAPKATALNDVLRKDESLDLLAESMNVAQFVSFSPNGGGAKQEFSRIAGHGRNAKFPNVHTAIDAVLRASADKSVNVRSYEPSSPQSREFIYGLTNTGDAVAAVNRLSQQGLYTIVNETIDVKDGGVSGVLMGDVLEFAPDDTPRCVEKPGVASLPSGWGLELLRTVYGLPISFNVPLASRLEFSVHPRPCGWRRSNILAWEYAHQKYDGDKAKLTWPNRFSKLVGDKAFGLLVAHHVGLPVPFTTVINRRIAPFSFGRQTGSGEKWIRTAPIEQVPGKYTTNKWWMDPFELMAIEDPQGGAIVSVLSQQGVVQVYSGALIVGANGKLIIEGKSGEGESLMLGDSLPEQLPVGVESDVRALYSRVEAALGVARFEWVYDGQQTWIVQLHSGATDTTNDSITSLGAEQWKPFDISKGLEELRKTVAVLPPGTGILLSGRIGLTSHFADVLRRAKVPARMMR